MRKYTLKHLRELVKDGMAVDVTKADEMSLPKNFERIGYSLGVNGMNGCLVQERDSGRYYAVIGRTSTLFYLM